MRRRLSVLLASVLCVLSLSLIACGSSSGSTAEEIADPSTKFVGTWKLASVENSGITFVGDFSVVFGEDLSMTTVLDKGGTGTMSSGGESVDITWALDEADENVIVISKLDDAAEANDAADATDDAAEDAAEAAEDAADDATDTAEDAAEAAEDTADAADDAADADDDAAEATEDAADAATDVVEDVTEEGETDVIDDSSVTMTYTDAGLVLKNTESGGSMLFTPDGTVKGLEPIDLSKAVATSSVDQVVGEWTLAGVCYSGATLYGDAAALSQMTGSEEDVTFIANEDGTATMFGDSATLEAGDSGVNVVVGGLLSMPVLTINDGIIIQMTTQSVSGVDMAFYFVKKA